MLAVCTLALPVQADEPSTEYVTYLRQQLGFSSDEIDAVERGRVTVRMLTTSDRREFAVVGVVKVGAPASFIVDRFRDIVDFKQSDLVLQVGRLGSPPRAEDLASIQVDPEDVADLRECRPGVCGVRLTGSQIERFNRDIDWTSLAADQQASHLLRQVLLEEATAYMTGGAPGLGAYLDKRVPLPRDAAVRGLLQKSPSLVERYPEFHQYLVKFPQVPREEVESFLYWSREKFGFRPVISLTHVAIYRPPGGASGAVIASKQVYASHYFDASFAVTSLVEDGTRGSYMMYLNRTQASIPGGLFSGLARAIARSKTRSGLEEQLGQTRQRIEARYRESG